jgi:dTDP-4-amino-4,6-dideoxygalactose transaminase
MNKIGPLPRYNTIGTEECRHAGNAMYGDQPLSGFLGGELRGGEYVRALEDSWCETFGSTHAIAVNSATSGLLAACHAIGVTNEEVIVSPYTMSATAAAPAFLGADLKFIDVEPEHYCLDMEHVADAMDTYNVHAVIATNLFGHPAQLKRLARLCHGKRAYLIEDNAQAPFAMENGSYAGTIGDIGVFSLNVHKAIQCGEGGVIVTDNDDFAHSMRMFINHGEMAGGPIGLNLRMTEVCAAIACAQLSRGKEIVAGRVEQAQKIIRAVEPCGSSVLRPTTREGCTNSFYCIPFRVHHSHRDFVVDYLNKAGVPVNAGYLAPLYTLPAFQEYATTCQITEGVEREIILWENCAYDPSDEQITQIGIAFKEAIDAAYSRVV